MTAGELQSAIPTQMRRSNTSNCLHRNKTEQAWEDLASRPFGHTITPLQCGSRSPIFRRRKHENARKPNLTSPLRDENEGTYRSEERTAPVAMGCPEYEKKSASYDRGVPDFSEAPKPRGAIPYPKHDLETKTKI